MCSCDLLAIALVHCDGHRQLNGRPLVYYPLDGASCHLHATREHQLAVRIRVRVRVIRVRVSVRVSVMVREGYGYG